MSSSSTPDQAELQAFVTNLPKFCQNTVFTLSGQPYTSAQLVTLATTLMNASAARAAAKASLTSAVQAEEKSIAQEGEVLREARDTLTLMFNSVPETLAAFLIPPKKPRKPLSAEARAAATAKMRATREARGTTSKEQKAKITGNVTGVVITPVTSPAASPAATPTNGASAPAASAASAPVATPAASNAPVAATPVTRS